jgi:hypothetical protein
MILELVCIGKVLPIGNWIFRGIGSGRDLRGGSRVETESEPCSPPNPQVRLTDQWREGPVNDNIPTETQQLDRFRRRSDECLEISRGSHDAKRRTSDRSLSTSECSFGAIGRVGLHAPCGHDVHTPFGSSAGSNRLGYAWRHYLRCQRSGLH